MKVSEIICESADDIELYILLHSNQSYKKFYSESIQLRNLLPNDVAKSWLAQINLQILILLSSDIWDRFVDDPAGAETYALFASLYNDNYDVLEQILKNMPK